MRRWREGKRWGLRETFIDVIAEKGPRNHILVLQLGGHRQVRGRDLRSHKWLLAELRFCPL